MDSLHSPDEITITPSESLLDKVFILHPDNRNFVAGKSRRTSELISALGCLFIAMPILFIITGAALFPYLQERLIQNHLQANGKAMLAEVTDKTTFTGEETSYHVTYQFDLIDNQSYTRETSLGYDDYKKIHVNDSVNIIYDPANPAVSRLVALEASKQNADGTASVIGGFSVISLFGAISSYFEAKNRRRDGKIVLGRLLEIKGEKDAESGSTIITYSYDFRSPIGSTLRGKGYAFRNDIEQIGLPPVGTMLAILFVNEKNFKEM
jgi:hypothetical protein